MTDATVHLVHVDPVVVAEMADLRSRVAVVQDDWINGRRRPPVVAALRAQQQQRLDRIAAGPSIIGSPVVFTSEAGTPLDPRNVGRWLDAVVKRPGLVGSLHTFRHSALSVMAENGVPMSTI
jgi:integrase